MNDLTETLAAWRKITDNPDLETRWIADALLAAVENVLTLHVYRLDGTVNECENCGYLWPCPTVKALTDALGGA